jgi:glycosyltransferase involved in cell wall biosynthesis
LVTLIAGANSKWELGLRLHGIMIVRDEFDIVTESLQSAIKWCDQIYVLDNGSTDGTWEQVQALAKRHKQIVPFKQDSGSYSNRLRHDVFENFKSAGQVGDWWCKLDADEIYIDNPHNFVSRIPDRYDLVFGASFQYYFTDNDLALYEGDSKRYLVETSVEDRLRYYINNHSEPRFVRDDGNIDWSTGNPVSQREVFPVRIWLKHFQYRSPEQIQRRLELRLAAARRGDGFKHEAAVEWGKRYKLVNPRGKNEVAGANDLPRTKTFTPNWRDRVVSAEKLNYDAKDGKFVFRDDLMKPLPQPSIKEDVRHLARRIACRLRGRVGGCRR